MSEKLKELKQQEARLQTRAFLIVLEIIVIFGVPAMIVVVLSKTQDWGTTLTYILLAVAFVLSWVVLLARVRRVSAELKAMREKVRTLDEHVKTESKDE